jgi:hypothetical protein
MTVFIKNEPYLHNHSVEQGDATELHDLMCFWRFLTPSCFVGSSCSMITQDISEMESKLSSGSQLTLICCHLIRNKEGISVICNRFRLLGCKLAKGTDLIINIRSSVSCSRKTRKGHFKILLSVFSTTFVYSNQTLEHILYREDIF